MPDRVHLALRNAAVGHRRTPILGGIDLRIEKGDVTAIVGPNGAGKSTLLATLAGIIPPVAGRVERREGLRVGYVPQRSMLDPIFPLTVFETVRLGGLGGQTRLTGARKKEVLEALEHLGVEKLAHRPFRELSGGQQQRVLIARALVRQPQLLVLDEPTTGMDIPAEQSLLDFVSHLNKEHGVDVVLVVHQLSVAAHRANRLVFVNKDVGLFKVGTPDELLSEGNLGELFGRRMHFHWCSDGAGSELVVRAAQTERQP